MTRTLNYKKFLEQKLVSDLATGHEPGDLNPALFPFQRVIVEWAIRRGRAAIFADTGLGKTLMQLAWARDVVRETAGTVLIFAPLAVSHQTVREGKRFGIQVNICRTQVDADAGINITNYEMLEHFDLSEFSGLVLDESSILKHHTSKTRTRIIEAAQSVPYRLSCTATPSPNDYMELGNQAEFLGIMRQVEMLSMFFTHDSGETSKWRLKGHGKTRFWEWMSNWAVVIRMPSDLGYPDEGFALPALNIREHVVSSSQMFDGELFPQAAESLSEQRQAQRESIDERVAGVAALVNTGDERWVIWCHLNRESAELENAIDGAVAVSGSDSISKKEDVLEKFSKGDIRVLVSKPSICGFGMNWQHCHQIAFVGLSHSFEQFYQAIRRCWRFGQRHPVAAHLFTAEAEGQVLASIKRKERRHKELSAQMVGHMRQMMKAKITAAKVEKAPHVTDLASGEGWDLHLGDCVDVVSSLDDGSVDYTLFSPPFSSLYTYSNSDRDMGNCKGDAEFYEHFAFLVGELFRVTAPGRNLSFHCMNLPTSKQHHGHIGLRDFRGEMIRLFEAAGWIFHSEVCIWKDPVTAMQRTKALGLLHKQLKKDSVMSRQGIPDYVVTVRKPGENLKPIAHTAEEYPVSRWQNVASPIWTDINQSRTLNYRSARESDDERHIAPLQLDVVERCIELWSAPGDLVLSPFAGIGTEGYVALGMGRRFVGAELKPAYWTIACQNLTRAKEEQGGLFA